MNRVTEEFLIWFKLGDGLFLDGRDFYEKAIDLAICNENVLDKYLDIIIEDIHMALTSVTESKAAWFCNNVIE